MSTAVHSPESELLDVTRALLQSLQHGSAPRHLALDSTLDRDLGLDSLARVELFRRIETRFDSVLPQTLFATASTLRDIADALSSNGPAAQPARAPHVPTGAMGSVWGAPPKSVSTLDQVLAWHCERHPLAVQVTVCGEAADESITYQRLWNDALAVAGGLQKRGVQPRDAVALMLPTGADYFIAFFGVLLAGAIPVPLYPPARASQLEEHIERHAGILQNCSAVALMTADELQHVGTLLRAQSPALRKVLSVAELQALAAAPSRIPACAAATALLQYTSGSTGQPKGVVLSHANLLANITALGSALKVVANDVFVSWLPLYHDMGLIGAWLGTLYFGLPLVVMSPLSFLRRPVRWLQTIDRYDGTLSAAPNFAYDLCLKRITDEELVGLDLHRWRVAANGAEFVMPETLERFQRRFAPYGLRSSALTPVYGKILLKTVHVWIGYAFALNLLWRFVWAFIGSPHARWRTILPGGRGYVGELARYLAAARAGRPKQYLAHNPPGRISVTVLLLLLLIMALTGLILAGTDLFFPPIGPWIASAVAAVGVDPATLVPYKPEMYDKGAYAAMRSFRAPIVRIHYFGFYTLLAVALIHIVAVVATELRAGGNLISAMFSGKKVLSELPEDRQHTGRDS